MKLIGFKRSNFRTAEGTLVTGYNLYLTYPASGEDAAGAICDRIYMTDDKLSKCGYVPHVGDEVTVTYNRFGKAAAIIPDKN